MKNKNTSFIHLTFLLVILIISCNRSEITERSADLILHNAYVYPVTGSPIENGAVVVKDGRIVALGTTDAIVNEWGGNNVEQFDCLGSFLMPGFIEGHGHFSALGFNLINVDLLATQTWQDVVDSVSNRVKLSLPGEWIVGRGWHQEKWVDPVDQNVNGYPYHDLLSKVSPDNPVLLLHASGHALIANEAAMKAAAVSLETPNPAGGSIVRNAEGIEIGVFEERAMDIIKDAHKEYQNSQSVGVRNKEWFHAINLAQQHCLSYGITSFQDAGSSFSDIKKYTLLAEEDSLQLRLWVMLRHPFDTLKGRMDGFPIPNVHNDFFACKAIKSEVDGALGSFGAWLLEPYHDKHGFTGHNTTTIEEIEGIAQIAIDHNMQLCVHAIGDKANREVLDVFEKAMIANPDKKDLRWRIEHAQHLHPDDIPRFKELGVIASMQGIHCTSDAPFVEKRLGKERAKEGAYAWRSLLDNGVIIANGTDAPIEHVNPIPNIYASVTRKRIDNGLEFFTEQKMTRAEALYSYTLGNAYAAFDEKIKGSIETGKWADMVLVSQNLFECPDDSIPKAKVLMTMVGGKIKYEVKSKK